MRVWLSDYAYPGLIQAYKDLGWEVFAGDERNWWTWRTRHQKGEPGNSSREFSRFMVRDVLANDCQVVIIGKGMDSNVPDESVNPHYWHIYKKEIQSLKSKGVVVMVLDLDAPDSAGFMTDTGLIGGSDSYGICCIEIKEEVQRRMMDGGEAWEFWPAWDQVLRTPTPVTSERPVDFTIVGSPYTAPNPAFGIPRRDIAHAAIEMGINVEIYGIGLWLNSEFGDPAFAPYYKGLVPFEEMHGAFARTKIGYNSFLRRGFRYLNDRPFVIAGAGAFVLSEAQLGLDLEFQEGKQVGWHQHRNIEDFQKRLEYWLEHADKRVAAAESMQTLTLEKHTYQNRAKDVQSAVEYAWKHTEPRRAKAKSCCR